MKDLPALVIVVLLLLFGVLAIGDHIRQTCLDKGGIPEAHGRATLCVTPDGRLVR